MTRAFDICSKDEYKEQELEPIQTVFYHKNNYPLWVINKVIDGAKKVPSADQNDSRSNNTTHYNYNSFCYKNKFYKNIEAQIG